MINPVILLGPKNSAAILKNAVELLKSGSVIALPTDTLYGIACLSQSPEALKKLYQIKSRDKNKPVAICVSQVSEIAKWGHVTVDERLLHDLLPGPVTLVFERSPALNPELNPGTKLVGIRIPDSWFIRQLSNSCAEPLALTSANISGSQSTLSVEEFLGIWEHLGAVFNGGPIPDGSTARLGSTVVDLSSPGTYRIIRPGCAQTITVEKLEKYGLVEASEPASENV
ncbi:hypothetical protein DAPPUDRAFT_215182 [Daphnia pulex]|uniref:Threonylcarbamoyl-AMP synthase n=1 Tax=Daphnia pulex TaxID=6669 RepID=E9H210_DAPPU|nr:hypothetical protein DAPPUDRAFT_215182 [Daphnia pulex]|eukprot:EFX74263.1 hypothetical protein DAPPUDRAFT_215182 [Daphnia pulex]